MMVINIEAVADDFECDGIDGMIRRICARFFFHVWFTAFLHHSPCPAS